MRCGGLVVGPGGRRMREERSCTARTACPYFANIMRSASQCLAFAGRWLQGAFCSGIGLDEGSSSTLCRGIRVCSCGAAGSCASCSSWCEHLSVDEAVDGFVADARFGLLAGEAAGDLLGRSSLARDGRGRGGGGLRLFELGALPAARPGLLLGVCGVVDPTWRPACARAARAAVDASRSRADAIRDRPALASKRGRCGSDRSSRTGVCGPRGTLSEVARSVANAGDSVTSSREVRWRSVASQPAVGRCTGSPPRRG